MRIEPARSIFESHDKTSGEETTLGAIENGLNITEVLVRGIARADEDRGLLTCPELFH